MITTSDLSEYYRVQKNAIEEEKKSEFYGITETERTKLRHLLGYDGDKKSTMSAGAYTRQVLKLDESAKDDRGESLEQGAADVGENSIGRLPQIFSDVSITVKLPRMA